MCIMSLFSTLLSQSPPTSGNDSDTPETAVTTRSSRSRILSKLPIATTTTTFTAGHAIPEILQEVFSYLSQHDLVQRTSRVNRLWRSISLFAIQGEVTWRDTMPRRNQELVLQRLGLEITKTVRFWAQDSRVFPAYEDGIEQRLDHAWDSLSRTIQSLHQIAREDESDGEGRQTKAKSTRRFTPRWQKLELCGEIRRLIIQLDPWIRQGSFRSISAVHLLHLTPGVIDLGCILGDLPNLTELVIESTEGRPFASQRNVSISWESQGARATSAAAEERHPNIEAGAISGGGNTIKQDDDDDWTMVLPKLRLRTLALRSILVNQVTLETLLGSMPQLHSLELQSLIQPEDGYYVEKYGGRRKSGGHIEEVEPFDPYSYISRVQLLKFLIAHCPRLVHFHLSVYAAWWKLHQEDMVQIVNSFSDLKSLSFLTTDIQLTTLPLFVDRLTSLEVIANGHTNTKRSCVHWYLCHAPSLLHIKMLGIRFFTNDFILDPTLNITEGAENPGAETARGTTTAGTRGNRASSPPVRPVPPVEVWNFQGRVWACRNLRSIELSIETENPIHYTARRHSSAAAEVDHANNRRLFAYLSLVCPKLEDITVESHQLDLSIQSGLVLLSRLERLRRLRFFVSRTPWFEKEGLEWMRIGWKVWPTPPPLPRSLLPPLSSIQINDSKESSHERLSWMESIGYFFRRCGWSVEERMLKEQASYQASLLEGLELVTKALRQKAKTLQRPTHYPESSVLDTYFQSKARINQDKEEQQGHGDSSRQAETVLAPLPPIELVTLDMLDPVANRFQELTALQRQHLGPHSDTAKRVWPLLESFEVYEQGGRTKELHVPTMLFIHKTRPGLEPWSKTN